MTDVPRGTSVTCARPHSNLHDNDSTTIIDKKTLFGVHAQVSLMNVFSQIANGSVQRVAGCQAPKPRCLSPAAYSLHSRMAGRRLGVSAVNSLDSMLAGRRLGP